ncbi:hypothetical protein ACHAXT_001719 [Thalassiosira profunda]
MPHPRRYLRSAAEPRALQAAAAPNDASLPPSEMVIMNNGVFPAIFSGSGVVGGRAFRDTDNDGLVDSDSAGVADVNVWLFSCAADAPIQSLAYARTASDGAYRFEDLIGGQYYLIAQPPEGYEFSDVDGEGGDSVVDSIVDPATGRTECFELGEGEQTTDQSFGVYLAEGLPSGQPSVTARPTRRPALRPDPLTPRPTPLPTPLPTPPSPVFVPTQRPSSPLFIPSVPSIPAPSQPAPSQKPSTAFISPTLPAITTTTAPVTSAPTATFLPSSGLGQVDGAIGGSNGNDGGDDGSGGTNNNAAVAAAFVFGALFFVALGLATGWAVVRRRRKREAREREGGPEDMSAVNAMNRGAMNASGVDASINAHRDARPLLAVEEAREAIQSSTILARYSDEDSSSLELQSRGGAMRGADGRRLLTVTYHITEAELENVRSLENEAESLTAALQAYPKTSEAWLLLHSYLVRAREELDAARQGIARDHSPEWDPAEGAARALSRERAEIGEAASSDDEPAGPLVEPPLVERRIGAAQNERIIGDNGEYSILHIEAPSSNLGLVIHREPNGGLVFVRNFHPLSPLIGKLQANDEIVAIDNADVQHLGPAELSRVMSQRGRDSQMTITVLRRTNVPPERELDHSILLVPPDTAGSHGQQQSPDNSTSSNASQDSQSESSNAQYQSLASDETTPQRSNASELGDKHVSFQSLGRGTAVEPGTSELDNAEGAPLHENADDHNEFEDPPSEEILFNVQHYIQSLIDADAGGGDVESPAEEAGQADPESSSAPDRINPLDTAFAIPAEEAGALNSDEAVDEEVRTWYAEYCQRQMNGIPGRILLKEKAVVAAEEGGETDMQPASESTPPQNVLDEEQVAGTEEKSDEPAKKELSSSAASDDITTYEPSLDSDSMSLSSTKESRLAKEETLGTASLSEVTEMLAERYALDVQPATPALDGDDSVATEGSRADSPPHDDSAAAMGVDGPPAVEPDPKQYSSTRNPFGELLALRHQAQEADMDGTSTDDGLAPVTGKPDVNASLPETEPFGEDDEAKPYASDCDTLDTSIRSKDLPTIEEEPTTLVKIEEIIQLAKSDRSATSFADELAKRCSEASSLESRSNSFADDESASKASTSTPKEDEQTKRSAAATTPSPTRPRDKFATMAPGSTMHSNYSAATTPNRFAGNDFASMLAKRASEVVTTPSTADHSLTTESRSQSDSSFGSTDGSVAADSATSPKIVIRGEAAARQEEQSMLQAADAAPEGRLDSEGTLVDWTESNRPEVKESLSSAEGEGADGVLPFGDYVKPELSEGVGAFIGWVKSSNQSEVKEEMMGEVEEAHRTTGTKDAPVEAQLPGPPKIVRSKKSEATTSPEEKKKAPKRRITPVPSPARRGSNDSFSSDSTGSSGYW